MHTDSNPQPSQLENLEKQIHHFTRLATYEFLNDVISRLQNLTLDPMPDLDKTTNATVVQLHKTLKEATDQLQGTIYQLRDLTDLTFLLRKLISYQQKPIKTDEDNNVP